METPNLETLQTFDIRSLPDLDVVTLGALELFATTALPEVDFQKFKRPLVVGSGNAAVTGKIIFSNTDAVFADETSYIEKLDALPDIDGAFLISASGGKHAIEIAKELNRRGVESYLITNNKAAPALGIIGTEHTFVLPKNREPYTYNTSTYMGVMLANTKEKPEEILSFITKEVAPKCTNTLSSYEAYYLMVPEHFSPVREMFATKFDELFGPRLMGRIFTYEQTKHAKTVVPMEKELFISFGVQNDAFGLPQNRLHIPLPQDADFATMMAVGYYVIGQIQKGKPAYFKGRIKEYCREISEIFGSEIKPIVE